MAHGFLGAFVDIAIMIYNTAEFVWEGLFTDLGTFLGYTPPYPEEWAEVLSFQFIWLVVGGMAIYISAVMVKWVLDFIK